MDRERERGSCDDGGSKGEGDPLGDRPILNVKMV